MVLGAGGANGSEGRDEEEIHTHQHERTAGLARKTKAGEHQTQRVGLSTLDVVTLLVM